MQGWLAATSSLTLAGATLAAGALTPLVGARAYLAMAGLAGAGLLLALATCRQLGGRLIPTTPTAAD